MKKNWINIVGGELEDYKIRKCKAHCPFKMWGNLFAFTVTAPLKEKIVSVTHLKSGMSVAYVWTGSDWDQVEYELINDLADLYEKIRRKDLDVIAADQAERKGITFPMNDVSCFDNPGNYRAASRKFIAKCKKIQNRFPNY